MSVFEEQVKKGDRFRFGANWRSYLQVLDDERIRYAEAALVEMLRVPRLDGRTFLDVGSGSGLSSLAARRLGAEVVSFDFDPDSVACTKALRDRFFPGDASWRIEQGSALDPAFMNGLPEFDIVYSWGVLHHTGEMWRALDLVAAKAKPHGLLEVAIYNDQGAESIWWRGVKQRYNALPPALRPLFVARIAGPRELRALFGAARTGKLGDWWRGWTAYQSKRGMSRLHDLVDWVGGYPFEVAKPEAIVHFFLDRGFDLRRLKTVGNGLGCNDFVFERRGPAS